MELHEFVRETLVQIIRGVSEAQDADIVRETGSGIVVVTPGQLGDSTENRLVDFDVAVTTQEAQESRGGVALLVGAIGLASQGKSSRSEDLVNRIRFSVPIRLPNQRRARGGNS